MDASRILARMKSATGGSAWDSVESTHLRMKIESGGLDGIAETWEDNVTGCHHTRFNLGPMKHEDGFDGRLGWTMDSSGQVRCLEGDGEKQRASSNAYRISHAYWYPKRWSARIVYLGSQKKNGDKYHVVQITPRHGCPFELWVNGRTWRIDRIVERSAGGTRTIIYSDYRSVGGTQQPFAIRSTNGASQYDLLHAVDALDINVALPERLFTLPDTPSPDYAFLHGKITTTVPFQLLNNHIYLEMRLDDRGPFLVLCDTGSVNIVTRTLAEALDLEPEGALPGRGVSGDTEDVGLVRAGSFGIGDATVHDQLFRVLSLEHLDDVEGVRQSGILGYDLFKRFVVRIDYASRRMTLDLPSTVPYEGSGTVVPFEFHGHIPTVTGSIDGIHGKFEIDTGSRSSLSLYEPFVRKHRLEDHLGPMVTAVTGWGIGGAFRAKVARAGLLCLGDVVIASPVTDIAIRGGGASADQHLAGSVGTGLLKRFALTFVYSKQEIVFEPNPNVSRQDVFDRSGMWINRKGTSFEVVDLIAGGPADNAGLRMGDKIVEFEGRPASRINLSDLRQRFQTDRPGTRIPLAVQGSRSHREIVLVLEDLV